MNYTELNIQLPQKENKDEKICPTKIVSKTNHYNICAEICFLETINNRNSTAAAPTK